MAIIGQIDSDHMHQRNQRKEQGVLRQGTQSFVAAQFGHQIRRPLCKALLQLFLGIFAAAQPFVQSGGLVAAAYQLLHCVVVQFLHIVNLKAVAVELAFVAHNAGGDQKAIVVVVIGVGHVADEPGHFAPGRATSQFIKAVKEYQAVAPA